MTLLHNHLNTLIDVTCVILEDAARSGDAAADDFADLADVLRGIEPGPVVRSPARLPVCRHWDAALALAEGDTATALAAALRPLAGALAWIQNPNFTAENIGRGFVENYGYADVVSPRGLVASDEIALGVLLLAPGLTYPPHAHPALEVYCVVGGDAEWRRGDGPWTPRSPGSLIHHAPGEVHATRTGRQPLLALYLWRGHLDTPAELTGGA